MKIFKLGFMLLLSILLSGCFDKVELEERGLVLAIGIDKYNIKNDTNLEKTGEEKRYTVSIAMPDISENNKESETKKQANPMEKEGENKKNNEAIKKAEGQSVSSTIDLIDNYTSKKLYYGHTKAVILGKEVLQDEIFLKETIDFLERNREISRKIIILASKERADNILQTIPKDEKMIGIYINNFYKNNKKNESFTFRVDLENIIQALLSTNGDAIIPVVQTIDGDIRFGGLAVLKNYKLISFLDDKTTKGLLWILDKNSLEDISIPFEDGYLPLSIFSKSSKMKFTENGGKIICNLEVNVKGNISEYIFTENIMLDTEKYKVSQKGYESHINNEISNSLKHIKSLGADIVGFKERIKKNNYKLFEKYSLEDKNIFDYLEFNIKSNVRVKNAGSIK